MTRRAARPGKAGWRRLSGWDAYLLYAETANVHTHTLKVVVLDPRDGPVPLTFERFRSILAAYVADLEPLRFQLLEVPGGLHHPVWLEDAAVDLDQHLFHRTAPAPGRRAELDEIVGQIGSTQLDRTRPLWNAHYVDGLAGGRVALVMKMHHALADGVASANLLERMLNAGFVEPPPAVPRPTPGRPSPGELLALAARDHVQAIRRLPSLLRRTALSIKRVRALGDQHAPGDLRLLGAPDTFLNQPLSPRRSYGTATMSLALAKRIGATTDVTVNDVLLALAAGALRQLFIEQGEPLGAIAVSVPMSTNRDRDRLYGNHLAGFFLTLPLDEADPVERLRRVRASAECAKRRLDPIDSRLYDDWVEYLPPRPSAAVFRYLASGHLTERNPVFNVSASNVPGPRRQGSMAGMPVVDIYSVGPVMDRAGVNLTVWSYDGRLSVGVITDAAVVPSAGHLASLVSTELDELRTALGIEDAEPVVGWDEPAPPPAEVARG